MVEYRLIYKEYCCDEEGEELTLIRHGDDIPNCLERYDRRTKTWINDETAARYLFLHPDKVNISENEVPKYLALFDERDAEYHRKHK